jgi:hypothetical protein
VVAPPVSSKLVPPKLELMFALVAAPRDHFVSKPLRDLR